jgi:hypothetical protein
MNGWATRLSVSSRAARPAARPASTARTCELTEQGCVFPTQPHAREPQLSWMFSFSRRVPLWRNACPNRSWSLRHLIPARGGHRYRRRPIPPSPWRQATPVQALRGPPRRDAYLAPSRASRRAGATLGPADSPTAPGCPAAASPFPHLPAFPADEPVRPGGWAEVRGVARDRLVSEPLDAARHAGGGRMRPRAGERPGRGARTAFDNGPTCNHCPRALRCLAAGLA